MQKKIHIVSFDVPFQPNYGGIMDVYLRARALKQAGFYVVIHAFEYGRGKLEIDKTVCDEVFYYARKGTLSSLSGRPYIVNSRKNKQLLEHLLSADGSIILEGQHCTSFVHQLEKAGKHFVIRMHNVEWQYYRELANRANTFFEKVYFRTESRRLRRHEHHLYHSHLMCISEEDEKYYRSKGVKTSLVHPPLFFDAVSTPDHVENYALFHGNLSVAENIDAVERILAELKTCRTEMSVVFAGKNPSNELVEAIENSGMSCVANPSVDEIQLLISGAKIHLCIGFQKSGLKLKLLRALETGRPIIATLEILHGTGLEHFCVIWDGKTSLVETIEKTTHLGDDEVERRVIELKALFSPKKYVDLVEGLLF